MAASHHKHFESDGNGGFYISKKFLTLAAICLTLLSAFASVIVYAQTIRYDVTQIQKEHIDFESQNAKQDAEIANIKEQEARVQQSLDDLKANTDEIKHDVKSLQHLN